jgi:DNA-binding CsgD family transcriptional regulator
MNTDRNRLDDEGLTPRLRSVTVPRVATLQVNVLDDDTVQVSGLSPQEVVNRLQRDHPADRLSVVSRERVHQVIDVLNLSEREVEVLRRITCGESNLELAGHMFLSVNTVKSYIRSSYRKLGLRSRSQAVMWGVQHGLADPDSLRGRTGPRVR